MHYYKPVYAGFKKYLSLIKLCGYLRFNMIEAVSFSKQKLKKALAKYCCYEVRYDRINMIDFITNSILA